MLSLITFPCLDTPGPRCSMQKRLHFDSSQRSSSSVVGECICRQMYPFSAELHKGRLNITQALEEAFGRDPILAPSTSMDSMEAHATAAVELSQKNNPNSRNVFAIIVSYYVKVRITVILLTLLYSLIIVLTSLFRQS